MMKIIHIFFILPLNGRSKSRQQAETPPSFPKKKKYRTAMGDTSFHLFRKTGLQRAQSS